MKSHFVRICIFLSVIAFITSCFEREEIPDSGFVSIESDRIIFGGGNIANDVIITRSGEKQPPKKVVSETSIVSENGKVSLPLIIEVEHGIHRTSDVPTKAAITQDKETITQLDAWCIYTKYTDATNTTINERNLYFNKIDNTPENKNGAPFAKESDGIFYPMGEYGPYPWEKTAGNFFNFYNVSPVNSGFQANINLVNNAVTFDYTVPSNASEQNDILVASPDQVPGNYGQSVPLTFKHVMAAVNVKVGNVPAGKIKSIKFTGVYNKGSYYPDGAEAGWTNRTIAENTNGEFNIILPEGGISVGPSSEGSLITNTETSFMMIPQQLGSGAEIIVEFDPDPDSDGYDVPQQVLRKSIQNDIWEMNTTTNYILSINENYNISIVPLNNVIDSHYFIAKVEISAKNLDNWMIGVSSGLRTTQEGVDEVNPEELGLVTILPEELVNPMAKQGYWTDKLLEWVWDNQGKGTGHYEETTSSARGNYYCTGNGDIDNKVFYIFIPENTSGKEREISISVTSTTHIGLSKSYAMVQYPVVWIDPDKSGNEDNYIGCEFLLEGGQVPWGFSWNGVEEKFRLTQGSGNPWGQIKNTLLPAMDRAGINYNNFPNYIWMATKQSDHKEEFVLIIDYSSIISTIKVATSLSDGNKNTWELYSFNPDDQLSGTGEVAGLGLISALKEVINTLGNVERVTEGDLGLVNTTDNYAALKALQRNRFNIYIDEANQIYLPVIKQADANWYLPAKEQFDDVLSISKWGQYFTWSDIYWTSSIYQDASDKDTGKAYMFNIGQTNPDDRINNHYAMAIRRMTYSSGVIIPPSEDVILPGEDGPIIGENPGNNEGGNPTVPTNN